MEVGHGQAQRTILPKTKIRIITILLRRVVSEIKLKRTDTTLDLSQKAKRAKEEKRKIPNAGSDAGIIYLDLWLVRASVQTFPHRLRAPRPPSFLPAVILEADPSSYEALSIYGWDDNKMTVIHEHSHVRNTMSYWTC